MDDAPAVCDTCDMALLHRFEVATTGRGTYDVTRAVARAIPAGLAVGAREEHLARAIVLAVAGRPFDLEHRRAHLGQVQGGQRAGQQLGEIEHADAGEQAGITAQRNTPSRSHLVATHFSPATTGAPPCSVLLLGWARS